MNLSILALISIIAALLGVAFILRKYQIQRPLSFCFSISLIIVSAFWLHSKYQFMITSIKAPAIIVQRFENSTPEGITYCFKAAFKDEQAKVHVVSTRICSSDPLYAIGSKVIVAYPAAMPEKAIIAAPHEIYLWPTALGLLGLGLLGLDSYQVYMGRKQSAA